MLSLLAPIAASVCAVAYLAFGDSAARARLLCMALAITGLLIQFALPRLVALEPAGAIGAFVLSHATYLVVATWVTTHFRH